MVNRRYYSTRTGKNPNAAHFDLEVLKELFLNTYLSFLQRHYFQEAFGYCCVDEGVVPGTLGTDIEAEILKRLRKPLRFEPLKLSISNYTEDDLFDIMEFLFDCVSTPVDGYFHRYGNCGWHYSTFDKESGREEYRNEVNTFLVDYQDGFELSEQGEILALANSGLQPLLDANLPEYDPENVEKRVQAAIHRFRRHHSSLDERKNAVRDLADVLEFLRGKARECLLSKRDEGDLFEIANKFAIRHHNPDQKTGYNQAIWYSWMFYFYLATIHAAVRVIRESEGQSASS